MLRQIIRVAKFWRKYARSIPVEAIDDKVMREFIPWCRDYYSKFDKLPKNAKLHPTDKTLQWDKMLGKAIIKWAHEQGLRGNKPPISATFTPKKKRVRPAFELWEYRRLWWTLCKRIKTARTIAHARAESCCATTFWCSQTLVSAQEKRTSSNCETFIRSGTKRGAATIDLS
jgi:hypothetical protein